MTPETLTEIYIRTMRQGNTSAAIEVAKQIGATVVVHDAREEARLKALGVRAASVERGAMGFAGTSGPYIVDLPVVAQAARGWVSDRERAEKGERRAGEEAARADGAEARAARAEGDARRFRSLPYEVRALLDLYESGTAFATWACEGCGGEYPRNIVTACPKCTKLDVASL